MSWCLQGLDITFHRAFDVTRDLRCVGSRSLNVKQAGFLYGLVLPPALLGMLRAKIVVCVAEPIEHSVGDAS